MGTRVLSPPHGKPSFLSFGTAGRPVGRTDCNSVSNSHVPSVPKSARRHHDFCQPLKEHEHRSSDVAKLTVSIGSVDQSCWSTGNPKHSVCAHCPPWCPVLGRRRGRAAETHSVFTGSGENRPGEGRPTWRAAECCRHWFNLLGQCCRYMIRIKPMLIGL